MILKVETKGKLTYVSATKIGVNHDKLGLPNQDAIAFKSIDENFVLAVSDGVGSCRRADVGSQKVVAICIELFEEIVQRSIAFESADFVSGLIRKWKGAFEDNLLDYCATVKTIIKVGNQAKVISLGDGFAAITSEGMKLITPYEDISFSNETRCLDEKVCFGDFWTKDFSIDTNTSYVVMACTDGVANAIQMGEELAFVEEIERNIRKEKLEEELKDFITDISKYSFDDKTLGVVKYER
jgi:serine/threonine protein phosphatase PrpC